MAGVIIDVEVAYARPDSQVILQVQVAQGATVLQAIKLSAIESRFPEIELSRISVGVFGKRCTLDTVLRPGDRVEIYRPLLADPKMIRRQRAAEKARLR